MSERVADDAPEAEMRIHRLAVEIAKQKSPMSALAVAATPHEIARALYLMGWQPPRPESHDSGAPAA